MNINLQKKLVTINKYKFDILDTIKLNEFPLEIYICKKRLFNFFKRSYTFSDSTNVHFFGVYLELSLDSKEDVGIGNSHIFKDYTIVANYNNEYIDADRLKSILLDIQLINFLM